mgnify:FL=1
MQTYLFNIINMPSFKEITFEQFYKLYPRKEKRLTAEKSFKKLSSKDKLDAYNGLINYIKVWSEKYKAEGWLTKTQYIPLPPSFINQRRWEDEIELPKQDAGWQKDATGRFFKGYCLLCGSGESYTENERKGDSRCCKADILPKRK